MIHEVLSQAVPETRRVQKPVEREILEAVMGVVTPGALQVLRISEAVMASPVVSPQGKAAAELVGSLAVLYFFIKLVEE
jgi:hypothetical protein